MKLDDLPKKNIYEVPADYFEKLPGVVMARVNNPGDTQSVFNLLGQLYWLKGALAGLALLIALTFIYLINTPAEPNAIALTGESSQILASVSRNDAMEYLLTSEQLENTDLAILPQSEQDFTHEFIQASEEELNREVEFADLSDITNN